MSEIESGAEPHDGERLSGVGHILGDYLHASLETANVVAAEGHEAHSQIKDNDGNVHDVALGTHVVEPSDQEGHYWLRALMDHKGKLALGSGVIVSGAAILACVNKIRQRRKS
jgi:hypothetical protein